jgi:nucleotide-binding universal stress UspA family protein
MPISRYLDRTLPLSRNPRESELRILVPIVRAQAVQTLIAVGDALAKSLDADGKVLGLVEVPRQPEMNVANQVVHRRRELLKWIADEESLLGSPARLGILVRVVHNVPLGIREAVYETGANLVVIEWPGPSSPRAGTLASVLDDLSSSPPADLAFVRPSSLGLDLAGRPIRIVVPIRGGANARLALKVAARLGAAWGGVISLLHVVDPNYHPDRRAHDLATARAIASTEPTATLIVNETAAIGQAIVSAAAEADVVVLGAYSEAGRYPVLMRPELAEALSAVEGMLILVRSSHLETEPTAHSELVETTRQAEPTDP